MVTGGFLFFGLRILRSMAFASGAFKTSHVNQPKTKADDQPRGLSEYPDCFCRCQALIRRDSPPNTWGCFFNPELWLDFLGPAKNTVAMHQSSRALAVLVLFCLASLVGGTVAQGREDRLLDTGWTFKSGGITNGWQPDLDTSNWESITIPHCWGWDEAHLGKSY
jgi:hypothetical protein